MPDPTTTPAQLPAYRTQAARDRDQARLAGVHPYLAQRIGKILDAMEILGFPMFVVAAVRTDAQQQALYLEGRQRQPDGSLKVVDAGAVVTNADGVTHKSMHQPQADGFGHAVDCAFVDDPITLQIETWDPKRPWQVYGTIGEAFGLTWGGRWVSIVDRPHLELANESPFARGLQSPIRA